MDLQRHHPQQPGQQWESGQSLGALDASATPEEEEGGEGEGARPVVYKDESGERQHRERTSSQGTARSPSRDNLDVAHTSALPPKVWGIATSLFFSFPFVL